ncbi:hypothetical protein PPACK8108_LOCUS4458 [Phakopsora pachyrhizi]|uniref:Uncharacterized protein n=1 Tax=Phakopsora pachyrhizi TaxID=170000 RepID=A0AAV0AQA0_PHAPC|nr:hypothetical protein PPACK8108_LOCUS4458 [Phakopsora pachyrhizi]
MEDINFEKGGKANLHNRAVNFIPTASLTVTGLRYREATHFNVYTGAAKTAFTINKQFASFEDEARLRESQDKSCLVYGGESGDFPITPVPTEEAATGSFIYSRKMPPFESPQCLGSRYRLVLTRGAEGPRGDWTKEGKRAVLKKIEEQNFKQTSQDFYSKRFKRSSISDFLSKFQAHLYQVQSAASNTVTWIAHLFAVYQIIERAIVRLYIRCNSPFESQQQQKDEKVEKYLPAWELKDGSLERAGRIIS